MSWSWVIFMDPWLKKVFRNVTSSSIPSIPVTKLRELKNRARHLGNDDLTDLSSVIPRTRPVLGSSSSDSGFVKRFLGVVATVFLRCCPPIFPGKWMEMESQNYLTCWVLVSHLFGRNLETTKCRSKNIVVVSNSSLSCWCHETKLSIVFVTI